MVMIDNVPTSEVVQRVYKLAERIYTFDNGWSARREGDHRKWILRNEKGDIVDSDQFRQVLFIRHGLKAL
jgi:hypothetical protein